MQAAVNVGIFSPSSVRTPFSCATGNCTFPKYRTVAYCGGCTDISSEVLVTQLNETTIMSDNSTYFNQGATNFTLPSGLWGSPWTAHQFSMGANISTGYYEAILGDSNGPYLNGNTTMLSFDCAPGLEWGCRGYGAAQCSLDMCFRTYSASIENGVLNETELSSEKPDWGNSDPKNENKTSAYISTIDMACLNNNDIKQLKKDGYAFNERRNGLDTIPYILLASMPRN